MALLFLMQLAVLVLHLATTTLAATAVGIARERVCLGFGPRLLGVTRGSTSYEVCALPFGSSVRLDRHSCEAATHAQRVMMPISALLAMGVPGVMLSGGLGPAIHWISGAANGLLHPADGAKALAAFAAAIPERPSASWGALLVVLAAFNALPLRSLNGGAILMELIPGAIERERRRESGSAYDWISFGLILAIFVDAAYIAIRASFV